MKSTTTVQERMTRRLQTRRQQQLQSAVLSLMRQAVLRACKGVLPSPADMKEHARLFDNERTGRMQLWWLGETVLTITPSRDGIHWEFMGSAAEPLQKAGV